LYTWNTKQFPKRRCDKALKAKKPAIEISVTQAQAFYDIRVETSWTREELKERVSKLIQTLENVERSLQFTNIPVHQRRRRKNKYFARFV
jgi:hypothetical protein